MERVTDKIKIGSYHLVVGLFLTTFLLIDNELHVSQLNRFFEQINGAPLCIPSIGDCTNSVVDSGKNKDDTEVLVCVRILCSSFGCHSHLAYVNTVDMKGNRAFADIRIIKIAFRLSYAPSRKVRYAEIFDLIHAD
ncbi:hypothetical protein TcasGA2_TC013641 [Tribolium castaneum]|uniref:Uncharacterized protein n=1 Tax=Tribolium castaneum TaxID=7070 RepID=D6W6U1_TRICA|nr:hypothetical protein TcasGA2_TC013641 [Tribolium castaneum]